MNGEPKLTGKEQKIINGLDNLRRQREWENSLEGIHYQLLEGIEAIISGSLRSCIVRAMQKIPNEVREFVYDKCAFAAVGVGGGQTIHLPSQTKEPSRPWLFLLCDSKLDAEYQSVIAHEIAHGWLKHKARLGLTSLEEAIKEETAACSLAKQWGFIGTGTKVNESYFEARGRKKSEVIK